VVAEVAAVVVDDKEEEEMAAPGNEVQLLPRGNRQLTIETKIMAPRSGLVDKPPLLGKTKSREAEEDKEDAMMGPSLMDQWLRWRNQRMDGDQRKILHLSLLLRRRSSRF
jgi:hypothetical protein